MVTENVSELSGYGIDGGDSPRQVSIFGCDPTPTHFSELKWVEIHVQMLLAYIVVFVPVPTQIWMVPLPRYLHLGQGAGNIRPKPIPERAA